MIRGLLALVRGAVSRAGISPLLSTGAEDSWTQIKLANVTGAGAGLGLSFKECGLMDSIGYNWSGDDSEVKHMRAGAHERTNRGRQTLCQLFLCF